MSATGGIKSAVDQLISGYIRGEALYSVVGKVVNIDTDARTCDVEPISEDADVLEVRLQATLQATEGFVCIPKDDSLVVVTFINKNTGFISLCTEIDEIIIDTPKITINGGDNGGLIIIQNLVDKINTLENKHDALVSEMSSHVHLAPQAPTGAIPTNPPTVPLQSKIGSTTAKSDIENDKVTH